jgi:hypothetical protein
VRWIAARTRFSVRASTGAVPFTTRETVAVDTPALFATSLMFMPVGGRDWRLTELLLLNCTVAQAGDYFFS